jgi:anti-sigma-K factor RskA
MNPHDWFVEHRVAFATRSLDSEDETRFADHLPRCEPCRTAVAAAERELAFLPMGARPVRPPPGFRWRVAHAVLGPRRAVGRRSGLALATAALALLAAGIAWQQGRARTAELRAELAAARTELAVVTAALSVMQQAATVLQASIEMDGHQGGMLIFADSVSHRWNVVVHGLPPARPGEKYQFWFVCSDGMVRGVVLEARPGRPVIVTVGMPERGGAVLGASLSVEPAGNDTDQPRGKRLVDLML